ncbi:MAG: hypothetical protein D6762_04465 [Candidatus Neomarinimicrobiota bacterium]|nr:MAG: hypothetical protein D6762_04465 [Candidatus Neomarinimicrobiota bacterium]
MKKTLFLSTFLWATLWAQVDLSISFAPYVTYYISSIDLNTGESSLPIFTGSLSTPVYPPDSVLIAVEFQADITSEALNMDGDILVKVSTDPFWLRAPVTLSNTDLTLDTREIFDSEGKKVPLKIHVDEHIDLAEAEDLQNSIIQMGKLPDGNYHFLVTILDGNDLSTVLAQDDHTVQVSTPTLLQLVSPGGALADTSLNEIFTTYPVFQWETDPCTVPGGCEYFIRVAEFNPAEHASVDQAIESQTRLPLDQTLEFYPVGAGVTSFQYPVTDAGDLEPGKVYVWQVKKSFGTTSGVESILSEIFAFKIKDMSSGESGGGESGGVGEQNLTTLETILGSSSFQAFFNPGGELENFVPTGNVVLDGNAIDFTTLQSYFTQGFPVTDSTGTVQYVVPEIISVEVSE